MFASAIFAIVIAIVIIYLLQDKDLKETVKTALTEETPAAEEVQPEVVPEVTPEPVPAVKKPRKKKAADEAPVETAHVPPAPPAPRTPRKPKMTIVK